MKHNKIETKSNVIRFPRQYSNEEKLVIHEQTLVNHLREAYNKSNKDPEDTNQGDVIMDWQEKYIDKLDREISDMKESLRATEERIVNLISQSLTEMRDRDNQRHQEFLELRKDNLETRRWIIGMVISAIGVSIAAIVGIASIILNLK